MFANKIEYNEFAIFEHLKSLLKQFMGKEIEAILKYKNPMVFKSVMKFSVIIVAQTIFDRLR